MDTSKCYFFGLIFYVAHPKNKVKQSNKFIVNFYSRNLIKCKWIRIHFIITSVEWGQGINTVYLLLLIYFMIKKKRLVQHNCILYKYGNGKGISFMKEKYLGTWYWDEKQHTIKLILKKKLPNKNARKARTNNGNRK